MRIAQRQPGLLVLKTQLPRWNWGLCAAIEQHKATIWSRLTLEQHAAKYGHEAFSAKMRVIIDELLEQDVTQ